MTKGRRDPVQSLLTVGEAAKILRVHPNTVRIWSDSGTLACYRIGSRGDRRFKRADIYHFLHNAGKALGKRRLELENREYQQHLGQKVEEQVKKIRTALLNAIIALVYAIEAKDKYTSGHSQSVAEISMAIAHELGMPQDSIEKIRLAGLIHDIGKIGVKESVLNKPGRLTDEEFQHVKYHSEKGEHVLTPIVEDEKILQIVRHHHERYDGGGYPDRLKGEQIPLGARIMALADTYQAMTSERPYRAAVGTEAACTEIERCKGTQFDPRVVDAFFGIEKFASHYA